MAVEPLISNAWICMSADKYIRLNLEKVQWGKQNLGCQKTQQSRSFYSLPSNLPSEQVMLYSSPTGDVFYPKKKKGFFAYRKALALGVEWDGVRWLKPNARWTKEVAWSVSAGVALLTETIVQDETKQACGKYDARHASFKPRNRSFIPALDSR